MPDRGQRWRSLRHLRLAGRTRWRGQQRGPAAGLRAPRPGTTRVCVHALGQRDSGPGQDGTP